MNLKMLNIYIYHIKVNNKYLTRFLAGDGLLFLSMILVIGGFPSCIARNLITTFYLLTSLILKKVIIP